MKITLIKPAMTDALSRRNFFTWNFEPLSIAILKSLTPRDVAVSFYDDRLESIPFDEPCDLVGITVDTSTARRGYRISAAFRKRGVPVVLGGYHPSLIPEEAAQHADAVAQGSADAIWEEIVRDAREGKLKRSYRSSSFSFARTVPDKSIFKNKRYLPFGVVETSRGCPYCCDFCSSGALYKGRIVYKSISDVKREIAVSGRRMILFADENIVPQRKRAEELLESLIPMNILWIGQAAPNTVLENGMVSLLSRSGCVALFIGFESMNRESLQKMRKKTSAAGNYNGLIDSLWSKGIAVYASFIAGYANSTRDIRDAFQHVMSKKASLAGFSPLTPYPGTPLYRRLLQERKLCREDWWMEQPYPYWRFVFFDQERGDRDGLGAELVELRQRFYSISSILRRLSAGLLARNPARFLMHLAFNIFGALEVRAKGRIFANG